MSNSRREGIVHRGMAQRALDTERRDFLLIVEKSSHAYDGIQPEQCQSSSGVIQIDCSFGNAPFDGIGQCVDVHLQSHCQGGFWTDPWPHTPELLPGDRLMQL